MVEIGVGDISMCTAEVRVIMQFSTQQLHFTPLPFYSPCYCAECKKPLTESRILDENSAWCPNCKNIVDTSFFQVPAWVLGVTLLLIANFQFGLWP